MRKTGIIVALISIMFLPVSIKAQSVEITQEFKDVLSAVIKEDFRDYMYNKISETDPSMAIATYDLLGNLGSVKDYNEASEMIIDSSVDYLFFKQIESQIKKEYDILVSTKNATFKVSINNKECKVDFSDEKKLNLFISYTALFYYRTWCDKYGIAVSPQLYTLLENNKDKYHSFVFESDVVSGKKRWMWLGYILNIFLENPFERHIDVRYSQFIKKTLLELSQKDDNKTSADRENNIKKYFYDLLNKVSEYYQYRVSEIDPVWFEKDLTSQHKLINDILAEKNITVVNDKVPTPKQLADIFNEAICIPNLIELIANNRGLSDAQSERADIETMIKNRQKMFETYPHSLARSQHYNAYENLSSTDTATSLNREKFELPVLLSGTTNQSIKDIVTNLDQDIQEYFIAKFKIKVTSEDVPPNLPILLAYPHINALLKQYSESFYDFDMRGMDNDYCSALETLDEQYLNKNQLQYKVGLWAGRFAYGPEWFDANNNKLNYPVYSFKINDRLQYALSGSLNCYVGGLADIIFSNLLNKTSRNFFYTGIGFDRPEIPYIGKVPFGFFFSEAIPLNATGWQDVGTVVSISYDIPITKLFKYMGKKD